MVCQCVEIYKVFLKPRKKCGVQNIVSKLVATYIYNRFIGESCRLIPDIVEINDGLIIEGLLVTMNIQKVFDSLEHDFFTYVLRKFRFGKNFMTWIKISSHG